AEGVGGEDARARRGVGAVQGLDLVGPLDVPQLAGRALVQPALLEVGAGGAVGDDGAMGREQLTEGHRSSVEPRAVYPRRRSPVTAASYGGTVARPSGSR